MKKITSIIISIIITSSTLALVGCNFKYDLHENVNENINKEDINLKELLEYRGTKIGDSVKVSSILEYLPGNNSKDGFSIQTKKRPYEITVNYKLSDEYKKEDITRLLYTNSIMLFSLVDNLEIVNIRLGEEHGILYTYSRSQVEDILKKDLRKLPQNMDLLNEILDKGRYEAEGDGNLEIGSLTTVVETSETDKEVIAKMLFEDFIVYNYGRVKDEYGESINILNDYKIKNVAFKSDLDNGDFRVSMNYDLQSIDGYVEHFTTGNGVKDNDNWVKDKFVIVDIEKIGENQYKLNAQYTG